MQKKVDLSFLTATCCQVNLLVAGGVYYSECENIMSYVRFVMSGKIQVTPPGSSILFGLEINFINRQPALQNVGSLKDVNI